MAGVRIITFVTGALDGVDAAIQSQFDVMEKTNKETELLESGRFGYKSIHYLVRLRPDRVELPEYNRFAGLVGEIQTRTILQHAWAEMEHDIQYKSAIVIPTTIRRRFGALAGMLEIADREFQAIQDEDQRLRVEARESVAAGNLQDVEITPDALKSYLDRKLGPDGRMNAFSYDFLARDLRHFGFETIDEIDRCLAPYDPDQVSRIIHGNRQGQISRFEDTLRAALGGDFWARHRWQQDNFWKGVNQTALDRLTAMDVRIGTYSLPPIDGSASDRGVT